MKEKERNTLLTSNQMLPVLALGMIKTLNEKIVKEVKILLERMKII